MKFMGLFFISNIVAIILLIIKFKSIGIIKRIALYLLFLIGSFGAVYAWNGFFEEPSLRAVEELTVQYMKDAKNIRIITVVEDKTKSKSYIVKTRFNLGTKDCEMKMNLTRIDGPDSWHSEDLKGSCNNIEE